MIDGSSKHIEWKEIRLWMQSRFSSTIEKYTFPNDIELKHSNCKWLLCGTYHWPFQSLKYFFNNLENAIDTYSKYEEVLLVEDFIVKISDDYKESFPRMHEFCNLVEEQTCLRKYAKSNVHAFKQTMIISTCILESHVLLVIKATVPRRQQKEIDYTDCQQANTSTNSRMNWKLSS